MTLFQRAARAVIRANEPKPHFPSWGCREYDYNETLVMFRNRDQYMPTQSPSVSPSLRASGGTQQGDFTDADLCTYQNYRGY